tara:strand:- start:217906 stop:218871 length:966 start_codon:yes stop_codon:yes gene_type:complete
MFTNQILMTGATGFVGGALGSHLVSAGNKIRALVRQKSDALPVTIEQVVADLTNVKLLSLEFFSGVDVVIHCAARVHILQDNSADPLSEFRQLNRDATLTLARKAAESGVKRFVFLSSIGVNGNNNLKPFSETDTPNPQESYAISKWEAELGLFALAEETGIEMVIIRPPLVYGPNAPGNFGSLIKWINKGIPLPFGSIHNQRSLVALDNLIDFIIHCIGHPKAANEVFLISDDEDVSTTKLLRKVANAFGKKPMLLPIPVWLMTSVAKLVGKGDVANRLFGSLQVDSSKARELLGWKPVITMDEQLKKTADAYLEHEKTL